MESLCLKKMLCCGCLLNGGEMVFSSVKKNRYVFSLLSVCAASANAFADDDIPQAQINGFATQGYSQVLSSTENSNLGVMGKGGTFLRDSIFGLNLSYRYNDDITFYGQLTASGSDFFTGEELNYEVQTDMIMLSYHPNDWLDVRIGRQIAPVWMVSEEIDVGLSYPWIRPPTEVYLLGPVKSISGIGADFRYNITDDLLATAGVRYGNTPYSVEGAPGHLAIDLSDAFIAYASLDINNSIKVRGAYGQVRVDSTTTPNLAFTSDGEETLSSYTEYITFRFYSAGVRADVGNFLLISEYARSIENFHSISPTVAGDYPAIYSTQVADYQGFYATAGYRLSDFTPHITYAMSHIQYRDMSYGGLASIPLPAPYPDGLIGDVQADLASAIQPAEQHTMTLGLNYNILPTIVLKGQYQYTKVVSGSPILILGPTLNANDRIQSISTAVSLVF